jgi:selenocysteine-specific elongation factor
MEELRAKLAGNISAKLFRELVQLMEQENIVARAGNLLRLPAHQVRLPTADKALSDKVLSLLAAQAAAPPDLKQLEKDSGAPRAKLSEVLHLMERNGEIARVSTDLYFPKDYIDKVKELLYKYLSENGEITAAGFRDLLGSSRKYTIALLEYFDREGFTIRIGDLRRLRSPFPAAGKLGAPR